jgi:serine/threonine-protein kinase
MTSSSTDRPVFNDRYEIHSRIGRGGMADVFLARDRMLDRPVAIKVLFPEYATDPNFVERFRREAQAAANLSHANIVGVYDWGKQGSTYFIVMEYVNGRTLADILKEGTVPAMRAAQIADAVAGALGFAHRSGVVHRDVKPANILVSTDDTVKVADFGIARALNSATEQDLTQAGAVMGTATYFSPEQAQGANPDPRSDLYSLGIVMYEMVAGKPPFVAENPVAVAYKQVHDQAKPLKDLVPGLPPSYDAITTKLLAKNPVARYRSAEDLQVDLRRFRDGKTVSISPLALETVATTAPTGVLARTPQSETQLVRAQQSNATQIYRDSSPPTLIGAGGPILPLPVGAPVYDDEPNRTGLYVGLIIGLVLALIVGGFFLVRAFAKKNPPPAAPATITLVDLTNKTFDEASTTLTNAGLKVKPNPVPKDGVGENIVYAQDPPKNSTVQPGSEVTLTFNPPKKTVTLPNLVGQQQADAEKTLGALGLNFRTEQRESDKPVNEVVDQNPPPGEVSPVQQIVIWVSSGIPQIEIPNVVGLDSTAAISQLAALGLQPKAVPQPSDRVDAGKVISTDPPAGQPASKGAPITVVVSSGATPVEVPDVGGMPEAEARDKLQGNFIVQKKTVVVADPAAVGTVVAQSPDPGQKIPKGSTVTLTIGVAPVVVTTTTTTIAPTTTASPPPSTTTTSTTSTTVTTTAGA